MRKLIGLVTLLAVIMLTAFVLPLHAATKAKAKVRRISHRKVVVRKGTLQNPIKVKYLESFMDGPYPGTPPDISDCTLQEIPPGTVAKAYSYSKGWAEGPTKYKELAWVAPNRAIRKWVQCCNPGGGYKPLSPRITPKPRPRPTEKPRPVQPAEEETVEMGGVVTQSESAYLPREQWRDVKPSYTEERERKQLTSVEVAATSGEEQNKHKHKPPPGECKNGPAGRDPSLNQMR